MSLPSPTTGSPFEPLSSDEMKAMEAPLLALASQSGGDLRRLMFAYFSFLHRRTDFYMVHHEEDVKENIPVKMGFKEGDAEQLLLAAFRQFPLRRIPRQGGGESPATKKDSVPMSSKESSDTTKTPPKEQQPSTKKSSSAGTQKEKTEEKSKDKGLDKEKVVKREVDSAEKVRLTEEGKQIPSGNGGQTARYRWTQTLNETSVIIGVPEGTRGKDLDVKIKATSISVKLKSSEEALLDGDLYDKIRMDESTWSLEGGVIVIILDKVKKTWWETVLVGDDVIDTSLLDSKVKIGEYDEATQGVIRKVLFDQRQERLGLPSSDQILGGRPKIPPLPAGVEYIDKHTFEPKKSEK
eukprot:scaffold10500_cov48-Attheya_sp.AAC.1